MITKRPDGSKRVYTVNDIPTKTDQSFKKDCDVNHIMKKYIKTGQVSHLAKKQGYFADVSQIPDLLTATQNIQTAQELFAELPSDVRLRFKNNPTELYNFLLDPSNKEESIKLGLREKPIENVTPTDVPKT